MCEKLLKLDMRKWLQLLSELDLLPVVFGQDWRFLWLQQISGTVTIVPAAPVSAYFRMISDPSHDTMRDYIAIGEACTWTKLARISNHYRLERLLNDCRRMLDMKVENDRRLSLQREVRQIVREHKQKERWSSEEGEDDDLVGKRGGARAEEADEGKGDDELVSVEKVGEMDSHPMRRASLAPQSRQIERALKARVVKEQLEQVKLGVSTPTRGRGREVDRSPWKGGDGVSETEKVKPGEAPEKASGVGLDAAAVPVDPAPPIVFDEEGQAYLTDEGADTDDDDIGPPASPLRNM